MPALKKMPCREGKTVQVRDRGAFNQALQLFAAREAHSRLFRFAFNDEIAMAFQQVLRVGRDGSKEAHFHTELPPGGIRPGGFVTIVHERGQDESDVALHVCVVRVYNFVPFAFEDRRDVRGVNARDILKKIPSALDPARCE